MFSQEIAAEASLGIFPVVCFKDSPGDPVPPGDSPELISGKPSRSSVMGFLQKFSLRFLQDFYQEIFLVFLPGGLTIYLRKFLSEIPPTVSS